MRDLLVQQQLRIVTRLCGNNRGVVAGHRTCVHCTELSWVYVEASRSGEALEVRIEAFDRTDWAYEPLALAVGADEVVSFSSEDLELARPIRE